MKSPYSPRGRRPASAGKIPYAGLRKKSVSEILSKTPLSLQSVSIHRFDFFVKRFIRMICQTGYVILS